MSKIENEDCLPYLILGEHMQTAANHDLSQYSETIHLFSIPIKYFTEHKCQDPWSIILRYWLTFSEIWRNLGYLPLYSHGSYPIINNTSKITDIDLIFKITQYPKLDTFWARKVKSFGELLHFFSSHLFNYFEFSFLFSTLPTRRLFSSIGKM